MIDEIFPDVLLIKSNLHNDKRGYFFELYNKKSFVDIGINNNFIQDNISFSRSKNTLRGLHAQVSPYEQSKLIFLLAGSILDVFIDIRKESKTFGKYFSINLTNLGDCLFIPKGFLHGFCTLEENTVVGYKVDEYYKAESETGIVWNDQDLNIEWPFSSMPIVSEKDSRLSKWSDFKKNL